MSCPRCNEQHNLEFLFDCEITYPFKHGGGNVMYDYTFVRCGGCDTEYAVRDDGLSFKRLLEKRKEIRRALRP